MEGVAGAWVHDIVDDLDTPRVDCLVHERLGLLQVGSGPRVPLLFAMHVSEVCTLPSGRSGRVLALWCCRV
jgi:hypothetical protein